ncbi:hypothetical protein GGI12_004888 [Dipsacomyces acuminosporus]|nr:hypothetical protein GGI12_004888 [Dipsacomyces acuminosporus]
MRLTKAAGYLFCATVAGLDVYGTANAKQLPATITPNPLSNQPTRAMNFAKRKLDPEDPANPVAAAATDPNEAAIKIKSRDLVPTDRPQATFHGHLHRHDEDMQDDGAEQASDDSDAKKPSSKDSTSKTKDSKPKDKENKDKESKDKDKDKDKDRSSNSDSSKDGDLKGSKDSSNSKGDKKAKKIHTGLDGNEVADEDEDGNMTKKKVQVEHVKATKSHWHTERPTYNYEKALEGWKKAGPLYYYKGKYANSASLLAPQSLGAIAAVVLAPLVSAAIIRIFFNS